MLALQYQDSATTQLPLSTKLLCLEYYCLFKFVPLSSKMSASNKHTHLRQAITSIKEACARTIRSRGSEYQPLLPQEVGSTKKDVSQPESSICMGIELYHSHHTTRMKKPPSRSSKSAKLLQQNRDSRLIILENSPRPSLQICCTEKRCFTTWL